MTRTYDAFGRLATITAGTGPDARTTTLAYDSQSYVHSITDPVGRVTSFTYDAVGRPLTQTLPDGRVIQTIYDANGNMTSLTPPARPAHTFDYTPVDLERQYTPRLRSPAGARTRPPGPTMRTRRRRRSPALMGLRSPLPTIPPAA